MNSGLILLNKKPGITSFDALRDIKRALGTGKVGHTGTLDKFAQGLLIVLAGKALKLSRWFSGCDKKYEGRIRFGIETDTLDPEGNIIAEASLPYSDDVKQVLSRFTGKIMQAPPAYSAVHINGQRASALARSGNTPEMKKRSVTVHKLELLSWEPPFADIFVHCSSGTYIRSLARDIALAAGSRAHLCSLARTQVAGFSLTINSNHGQEESYNLQPVDRSVIAALGMSWFEVTPKESEHIAHGKPPALLLAEKTLYTCADSDVIHKQPRMMDFSAAVFCDDRLIAVVETAGGKWKYGVVINS